MPPETRYAHDGDVSIAYQTFGEGSAELVIVPGPASHLEVFWEEPLVQRYYARLARFARVAVFDRRGTGGSDPIEGPATLEQQMDDIGVVCETVGFARPALLAGSDAARSCLLYAATHPDRISRLVLTAASAVGSAVMRPELKQQLLAIAEQAWGKGELTRIFAPSMAGDAGFVHWMARVERYAVSPGMARRLIELSAETDVRPILPAVRVPVLLLHRREDRFVPIALAREIAGAVPDARLVELEGTDTLPFTGDQDAVLDEIEEFLTGRRSRREPERVLATVLFTDIVDSTLHTAELGDARWRQLLDDHHRLVRRELERFRGQEIKTLGDGFLATFDGPARAVRCAEAVVSAVAALGLHVRASVHTGEIEVIDEADIGGLAVHIGARVLHVARPGEVLVSQTVCDLVVGSGLEFAPRGEHALRGVPGDWALHALHARTAAPI